MSLERLCSYVPDHGEYNQGPHDESAMPTFWDVIWVVELDQSLNHRSQSERRERATGNPSKPLS